MAKREDRGSRLMPLTHGRGGQYGTLRHQATRNFCDLSQVKLISLRSSHEFQNEVSEPQ